MSEWGCISTAPSYIILPCWKRSEICHGGHLQSQSFSWDNLLSLTVHLIYLKPHFPPNFCFSFGPHFPDTPVLNWMEVLSGETASSFVSRFPQISNRHIYKKISWPWFLIPRFPVSCSSLYSSTSGSFLAPYSCQSSYCCCYVLLLKKGISSKNHFPFIHLWIMLALLSLGVGQYMRWMNL